MSLPGENIVTLPDRQPEVSLQVRDVRKVHAAGVLGTMTVTQARALRPLVFNPRNNGQTTAVLNPVIAATWDALTVRVVPGAAFVSGVYSIVCGWSHSELGAPTTADEVAALPGAAAYFFGSTTNGPVSPPEMLIPCPFVMGISRQAKPRDLYGGQPTFCVACFSASPASDNAAVALRVLFHGDLSVKGSDIVLA